MWTVSDTRLQKAACIFVLCDSAYNRGFQQYPFWLLPVVLLWAGRYIYNLIKAFVMTITWKFKYIVYLQAR